jgi:sugar/nucleoside kinase (ribokinase family)
VTHFKAGLLEMIGGGVDLLFATETEAKGMAGCGDLDGALAYLKTIAREFAITREPKGTLVWDGNRMIAIDSVKVRAVDSVGAGDLFAGAFLYGLTQGWGHQRAGALASAAATKLVTSLGPRISATDTQEVVRRLL